MSPRQLLVIGALVVAQAVAASAQTVTARQAVVLAAMDSSGDGTIDEDELRAFLRVAVPVRAAEAGLTIGAGTPAFDSYLQALVSSAQNHSSADGNDDISPAEIAALETTPLPAPLGGSIKDLLPQAPSAASAPSWTDHLGDWLDIRNSFLDEQSIGKPAKLTRTHVGADDETVTADAPRDTWTVDASLIVNGFLEWKWTDDLYVRPIVGYEVHVDSSKPESDRVVHRAGADVNFVRGASDVVQSHRLLASFDYATDRGYDAKVFGATLEYTLNATRLGIGRYLGGGREVDFRWRPYAGIVWADVVNAGSVKAFTDLPGYTHAFVKVAGELRVGKRGLVTPELVVWHGTRTDAAGAAHHWQSAAAVNPRWILSMANGAERASIGLAWTIGRDSPGFDKARQLQLALAFKF